MRQPGTRAAEVDAWLAALEAPGRREAPTVLPFPGLWLPETGTLKIVTWARLRLARGQGGLLVTPMQMAMVASAVANGGKLMRPHFTSKVIDQNGRTVQTIDPSVYNQVMKPSTAQQIGQMMKRVVDEGTGTPAQLGSGVEFAGKTGTASVGVAGLNLTQPWFIGFAPIQHPKVAIAVTVERSQGGFGGTVAAPIAKAVVQTLLSEQR